MPKKVISDSVALIARGLVDSGHISLSSLAQGLGLDHSTLHHAIRKRKMPARTHELLAEAVARACREHEVGSIRAAAVALRTAADRLDAEAATLAKP
jgi:hypothetical protein